MGRTVSDDASFNEDKGEDEGEDADACDLVAEPPGEDRARSTPILAVFVIIQGGEVLVSGFSASGLEPAELAVGRIRECDEGGVEEGAQDVCLRPTPDPTCASTLFALLGVAVGVLGEGCAGLELDHLDAEGVAEDLLGGRETVTFGSAGYKWVEFESRELRMRESQCRGSGEAKFECLQGVEHSPMTTGATRQWRQHRVHICYVTSPVWATEDAGQCEGVDCEHRGPHSTCMSMRGTHRRAYAMLLPVPAHPGAQLRGFPT